MSTYVQILYQIVYSTKNRIPCLAKNNREKLHRYIWGVLEGHKCHPYYINGVDDHLHIATHIHPTVALSDLVKDIKLSTADLIQRTKLFPRFHGWQGGYAAFSYSSSEKERLVQYIKNQEEHHKTVSFADELKALLEEHGVVYDERFLL